MNTIKLFLFLTLLCSPALFSSCSDNEEDCTIIAQFQSLSEMGCEQTFVLELDDENRVLNPTNLDDFDISPTTGVDYCISFTVKPDVMNSCAVAETVELISIQLK